ncbi:protein spaetzle-like isoform X2 [Malaya genurostris]|uniref:protein spaetzle-like isoform X2 n=1 Tax=Malaya genurostris TaxID=325434 RepID=UPI0026F3894F|nr:protein spaetzle-like isoform X2 [Malaya genurostris]
MEVPSKQVPARNSRNEYFGESVNLNMIQRVPLAIWLSSGLVIIFLFMCTIMLMIPPTYSAAQFRPLVREREIPPGNDETSDEELKTRIQEIYKRKGYSNPAPDPEDYPEESMPAVLTTRLDSSTNNRTRRPVQKISKDFDPSQSYVIKHANGSISYVFPEKIASTTAGTNDVSEKATGDVTYRTSSSESSDFVFPNELTPKIDVNRCHPKDSVCSDVINYPEQLVNDIIDSHGQQFKEFFGEDIVVSSGDKLVQRFDTSDDEFLCRSEERLIHPKSGLNKDDQTVMIVNTANYVQGVRMETCSNVDQPCDILEHGSLYTTECKQLYHYRTLVAINPTTNQLYKDAFRLPSCCKCVRRPTARALQMRHEAEGL